MHARELRMIVNHLLNGTLIYDLWLRMLWLHKRLCKFLMKP